MTVVDKALWLIESNLNGSLALSDLAQMVGVTPFHLARSFALHTGQPVMRYVWRRRLTRAAQALAFGHDGVLTIALDAGYASHEAFGRAFRAEFGLTPSDLRRRGNLNDLSLTQPQQPRTKMTTHLTAPTIDVMPTRRFAGPSRNYDMTTRSQIPGQWVDYNTVGVRMTVPKPYDYFGIVYNFDDETARFDYLCGQEIEAGTALPAGFASVTLSGRYARFATKGHISTMSATWSEIYEHWMNRPEYRPRRGPSVEYYPPEFDPMTGEGGYEIWLPIED